MQNPAGCHGLYVHVPFCVRKCGYCDFYSLPQPASPPLADPGSSTRSRFRASSTAPDAGRYLAALERELELAVPPGFRARTVFVGGGTPTELGEGDLARLLAVLRRRIDEPSDGELGAHAGGTRPSAAREGSGAGRGRGNPPDGGFEFTVESNPGTLSREKALLLQGAGVTRVSMGVQSLDPECLAFLGRIHSAEEAVASYRLLRELGFDNLNLDLIFGIPGSSRERLRRDVEAIAALGPEHISCYCLIFEEGTPLHRLRERGLVFAVDDEEELAQYALVRETLARAGYRQYEISNFARPGYECRHNLLYWGPGEYYGLGPSAHGHVGGVRAGNVRDLGRYCRMLLEENRLPREFEERLEPAAKARESLVMGLRRVEGVERARFRSETGFDYEELRGAEIRRLAEIGMLEVTGESVRLTERGLFVSDSVFAELV